VERHGVLLVLATLLRCGGPSAGEGGHLHAGFRDAGPQSGGHFRSSDLSAGHDFLAGAAVPAVDASSCHCFVPRAVVPLPMIASLADEPAPFSDSTAFFGGCFGAGGAGVGEVRAASSVTVANALTDVASATGDSQGVFYALAEPTVAARSAGVFVTQAAFATAGPLGGLSDVNPGSADASAHLEDTSAGPQHGEVLRQHCSFSFAPDPAVLAAVPGASSAAGGSPR